jgi:hypothetical protein
MTDDDHKSWAVFRDPVESDLRASESPKRVIHLPQGIGPRESLNLNDDEDVSRLIVFFLAELEEIRVSIAKLVERGD